MLVKHIATFAVAQWPTQVATLLVIVMLHIQPNTVAATPTGFRQAHGTMRHSPHPRQPPCCAYLSHTRTRTPPADVVLSRVEVCLRNATQSCRRLQACVCVFTALLVPCERRRRANLGAAQFLGSMGQRVTVDPIRPCGRPLVDQNCKRTICASKNRACHWCFSLESVIVGELDRFCGAASEPRAVSIERSVWCSVREHLPRQCAAEIGQWPL